MLTDMLRNLPRPIAQVVHLGAGYGDSLSAYLEADAGSILLVEADADVAAELATRHRAESRVKVLQEAVSGDTAPRPFFQANVPSLSSLRPLDGLRELFPGLRILSEKIVTPADPATLLDGRLVEDGSRLLVLETPAETLGILKALDAAGLLQSFDAVALREWREPFNESVVPLDQIRDCLECAGFLMDVDPDPQDPDRPWLSGRINRAMLQRCREAEAQIIALDTALVEVRAAAEKQGTELEATREQAQALTSERDTSRKALAEREAELKELREKAQALTVERDAAFKDAKEQDAARHEADRQLEKLRDTLLVAERKAKDAEATNTQIQSESDKTITELQAQLHRVQGDLTMALRGQAMVQADLRDLQTRYGEARASREQQAQLLTDLLPYLRRLLETAPVDEGLRQAIELNALPDQATLAPSRTLRKKRKKKRKKSRNDEQ
jgi:hypothetical protein